MNYREQRLTAHPKLRVEPGHMMIHDWDVDCFGQDDGSSRDPNDSYRLIFELGAGYFTCLLVVGMAQPDGLGRFTSFWFKGIVAVDVDMEEYGAPSVVEGGPFEVPVLFSEVAVWRVGTGAIPSEEKTAQFAVTGASFEARTTTPGKPLLTMRWRLSDDAVLVWTSATANGWSLSTKDGERQLGAGDYVTFAKPTTT